MWLRRAFSSRLPSSFRYSVTSCDIRSFQQKQSFVWDAKS